MEISFTERIKGKRYLLWIMASALDTCSFAVLGNSDCSANTTFIHLYNCSRDTSNHLSSYQCSEKIPDKCLQFYDIPEALLILYRSGIFSIDHTTLKLKTFVKHIVMHQAYTGGGTNIAVAIPTTMRKARQNLIVVQLYHSPNSTG